MYFFFRKFHILQRAQIFARQRNWKSLRQKRKKKRVYMLWNETFFPYTNSERVLELSIVQITDIIQNAANMQQNCGKNCATKSQSIFSNMMFFTWIRIPFHVYRTRNVSKSYLSWYVDIRKHILSNIKIKDPWQAIS